ncbi:hypothetical protein L9F63_024137, partial [Diploptera punctata]
ECININFDNLNCFQGYQIINRVYIKSHISEIILSLENGCCRYGYSVGGTALYALTSMVTSRHVVSLDGPLVSMLSLVPRAQNL